MSSSKALSNSASVMGCREARARLVSPCLRAADTVSPSGQQVQSWSRTESCCPESTTWRCRGSDPDLAAGRLVLAVPCGPRLLLDVNRPWDLLTVTKQQARRTAA